MKTNKGITLIALTITIIVLIILASVTTYTGINTVKSSKLNKFKQELEIMQAEVNLLYEKYKNDIEANIEINIGKDISTGIDSTKQTQANDAFNVCGVSDTDKAGYRLFDADTMKELNIEGIEREYLVNIAERDVICLEGFKQDGTIYYRLDQLTSKTNIKEGITRDNVTFSVDTQEVGEGWQINISDIQYSKYVGKGKILYQNADAGNDNWTTLVSDFKGNEYSFVIKNEGKYNIKIIDAAGVEKITDTPVVIGVLGNYLVDETSYYNTLLEAVAAAQDGSIIKVLKDTTETEYVTINKDIVLDTNGKTINYEKGNNLKIEANKNVVIKGNGTIISNGEGEYLIRNDGDMEINGVTLIHHNSGSSLYGTIVVNGKLTVNSGSIQAGNGGTAICPMGSVVINSGIIEGKIFGGRLSVTINGGEIQHIVANNGGRVIINSGIVDEIELGNYSGDIFLTIGDSTKPVSTSDPNIKSIGILTGDLSSITTTVNFYNGIVKVFGVLDDPFATINIRSGYTTQTTTEGTILVSN